MSTGGESQPADILATVQKHIPNASFRTLQSGNESEVAIALPNEGQTTSLFPSLFSELSERKEEFGIQTIGVSLTTMDEVFVM
jgi:hypothetical protein